MPHRLGKLSHHQRGSYRIVASPVAHFLEGRQGRAARATPPAAIANRSLLPRLHSVLRILPRRQRPRYGRIASVRMDVADRQAAHAAGVGVVNGASPAYQGLRAGSATRQLSFRLSQKFHPVTTMMATALAT